MAPLTTKPPAPTRGRRCVPLLPRVHFLSTTWQTERERRLLRIFRCLDRGLALGKALHPMLVKHAWRWRGRRYRSQHGHPIRFSVSTLDRLYRVWCAGGRTPAALALRYRAPVKIHPRDALKFSRVCINSPVSSFEEAYGRLPNRPRGTWFAYRLALPEGLRRQMVRLFSARRLLDFRQRKARSAVNRVRWLLR